VIAGLCNMNVFELTPSLRGLFQETFASSEKKLMACWRPARAVLHLHQWTRSAATYRARAAARWLWSETGDLRQSRRTA